MIFINNSGDYSECGIGKAPIISEETKQLLSGFTGVTNKKAIAFQNFTDAIGGTNGTIWDALDALYIPMFANGVMKDAFFNVKTGEIAYPGSSNNPVTDENVDDYYVLTNNGIMIIPTVLYNQGSYYTYYNTGKTKADCLMFAVSEPISKGSKQQYIWYEEQAYISTANRLDNNSFGTAGSSSSLAYTTNTENVCPVFVSSIVGTDGMNYIKSGSADSKVFTKSTSNTNPHNPEFGTGMYTADYRWGSGLKVFGYGDGLSAVDARTFADALASFNDAMLDE